jgi:beta-galactosidase
VGNGNPGSHEADRYFDNVNSLKIEKWRTLGVDTTANRPEVAADFDDSQWKPAREWRDRNETAPLPKANVYRSYFVLPEFASSQIISLLIGKLGENQNIFINGQPLNETLRNNQGSETILDRTLIHTGKNAIAVVTTPFKKSWLRPELNSCAIKVVTPADPWKRKVFNGLAQVIVQATKEPGEITLTATAQSLSKSVIKIQALPAVARLAVAEK